MFLLMVQVVQDSNPDMDVVASVDGWVITSTCSLERRVCPKTMELQTCVLLK